MPDPMSPDPEVVTADDIRRALTEIENTRYTACQHAFHPKYAGRRLALTAEECDVSAHCGMCFRDVWLAAPTEEERQHE